MRRAGVLVLAMALPAWSLGAQVPETGGLISAAMDIDATGSGPARISIRYRISLPPAGGDVPITVLSPEPTTVRDLAVEADRPVQLDLPRSTSAQREGWIRMDGAGPQDFTLTYAVHGFVAEADGRLRFTFPVVAVDWPPLEALPGTFEARIHVPEGVTVYESFPTALAGLSGGLGASGTTELDLSVLPAYVTLRASRGDPPRLTVPGAVDGSVIAVLLVLAFIGWRRMKATL